MSPVLSCSVLSCVILCCVVLCYLVLSCVVLSCVILSCVVLSCVVLSCVILSCLVLSYLVLSYLVLSCVVLSYFFFPFIFSRLILFSQAVAQLNRKLNAPADGPKTAGEAAAAANGQGNKQSTFRHNSEWKPVKSQCFKESAETSTIHYLGNESGKKDEDDERESDRNKRG